MSSLLSCPSFVDRYFTRRYAVDIMNKPNEDHCLLFHSNGVSVLTLAPSHPILRKSNDDQQQIDEKKSNLIVKSVDYKITSKVDRMDNKVVGKSKRGAQNLATDSPVCRITCSDGETGLEIIYTIRACVNGRLIEVNERLIKEPQLLVTHPETLGYICVIVQRRLWSQREGEIETKDDPISKNKIISLIDRRSYLRLRFPDQECQIDDELPLVKDTDMPDDANE